MRVFVNGVEMEVPAGTTLSGLMGLMQESYTPDMIVEINRRFIHVEQYDATYLKEGDRLEVIHLAMGG